MNFLKSNKRFSFKIGEKNAWDIPYKTEVTESGGTLTTVYTFDGGLRVTNTAKKYEKYGAYEWVNIIEHTSDKPTDIISELWDCDITVPLEHEDPKKYESYVPDAKKATKVYAPTGSRWNKEEFYTNVDKFHENCRLNHIYPNDTKYYATSGGRSSEERAPFFNVHKNGKGYIFAIGWTGQWNSEVKRAEDSITFKSKIEDTHFRVMPGEILRTSSIVVMPYEGDVITSQNKWRRLVKEHFSLIGTEDREKYGPLCAGIWGGMKTQSILDRIDVIKKNNLPFEYIWIDAGWYGAETKPTPDEFEGDWGSHTGDWRVSPFTHPNGLKDVSKAIHDANMKFLLWVEPERVIHTTPIVSAHPEYFLTNYNEYDHNRLLYLGNDEAWNYCFETLSNLIEELNIDCYRQDFNFAPLDYWRKNDTDDRRGISEIKHINGLYRLWDSLLDKFPNLIIDNCASGGRRIDIETLRRSIPLWRSDHQCPANYDVEASQCHTLTFNSWMPYSGTGTGRPYDEYRIRSSYASGIMAGHSFSEREAYGDTKEKIDFLKKYTEEYLKVRPYFSEDFYPLTECSDQLDVWSAAQFNRPSENDGVIQVFRRENSPYETSVFMIKGLDENKDYLFTDADGGEFTVSGKEIAESGFRVTIPTQRKAKVYFYKSI